MVCVHWVDHLSWILRRCKIDCQSLNAPSHAQNFRRGLFSTTPLGERFVIGGRRFYFRGRNYPAGDERIHQVNRNNNQLTNMAIILSFCLSHGGVAQPPNSVFTTQKIIGHKLKVKHGVCTLGPGAPEVGYLRSQNRRSTRTISTLGQ